MFEFFFLEGRLGRGGEGGGACDGVAPGSVCGDRRGGGDACEMCVRVNMPSQRVNACGEIAGGRGAIEEPGFCFAV